MCPEELLREESAGAQLLKDLDGAISRNGSALLASARINDTIRKAWRDLFDPRVENLADRNYEALRLAFTRLGDISARETEAHEGLPSHGKCAIRTFREFVSGEPLGTRERQPYLFFSGPFSGNGSFMSMLMNREESYFVVAVMSNGFFFGARTEAVLRQGGKSAGFALVGYTSGMYPHADHQHAFCDGSTMEGSVFVAWRDAELIDRNMDKPVLIVDDTIAGGDTVACVEMLLRAHGAMEIYKMADTSKFAERSSILYL